MHVFFTKINYIGFFNDSFIIFSLLNIFKKLWRPLNTFSSVLVGDLQKIDY